VVVDLILVNVSLFIAFLLRFDWDIPSRFLENIISISVIYTGFVVFSFFLFGLYQSLWRYAGDVEMGKVIIASTVGVLISAVLIPVFRFPFPRSVHVISLMLLFISVGGSRIAYRILRRYATIRKFGKSGLMSRVLIVGGGDAGALLIKELKNHYKGQYHPVAVMDDDPWKWKAKINGVPVKGGMDKLIEVVEKERVDEIIIAIPSASRKRIAQILKVCAKTNCKLKTLPSIYDIVDNKVSIHSIREVSIEDLLGREEMKLEFDAMSGFLKDQVVMVTGGGGSIGSELCRQIAKFSPQKLLILDNYENSAYELQKEIEFAHPQLDLEVVIASIRDRERMVEVFSHTQPSVVFHAAAHKHVSLMENNPAEAIKNNVLGTLNVAQCAHEFSAKGFVFISSDKAVNPTNVMGATKRIAEMIIQSINRDSKTEFVAVRFGNVLGSNGSVVPLFQQQIKRGGPVTVTHPEVTRFFMTIPEAVSLVIQAGAMAKGGEIFVLDMGEPVKILDLATELIKLSGFEPEIDIQIEFSGLKPGEKLYEELLMKEEGLQSTKHQDIFVAKPIELTYQEILRKIEGLEKAMHEKNRWMEVLKELVPSYRVQREE
jgi:FlaA1/EpsC-like NDP-sugar epimerase